MLKNRPMTHDKVALFIKKRNLVMNFEYIGTEINTSHVCVGVGDIEYANPLFSSMGLNQLDTDDQYYIMTITIFLRMMAYAKQYIPNVGCGFTVIEQAEMMDEVTARLTKELYDTYKK